MRGEVSGSGLALHCRRCRCLRLILQCAGGRADVSVNDLRKQLSEKDLQLVELRAQRWELADALRMVRAELTAAFEKRDHDFRQKEEEVHRSIHTSQVAVLLVFSLFFCIGWTIFFEKRRVSMLSYDVP